ncbi:hypothetical protein BB561_005305 [Smittium simulii]|uniref:mRNA 3'-end-processing protein n=1 Tax=Smittium simulii TaxID=133385 RepID=A0A2T9YAY7_9FUNG|nr:hypothetical protein BB561_005305 [Smittium simulii]
MLVKKIGVLDANLSANQVWFDFEDYIKENLDLVTIEPIIPSKNSLTSQPQLNKKLVEPTGVCNFYLKGHCWKGSNCQYRHITLANYNNERLQQQKYTERAVVCKHWLRGLCKKGENCEFLHEYNLTKMPACWFFAKYGECGNSEECVYQHIDPDSRIKSCPWYARGFCKNGPSCKRKHQRKIICKPYLFGFCPNGSKCSNTHPSFDIPTIDSYYQKDISEPDYKIKNTAQDNSLTFSSNKNDHHYSSNTQKPPYFKQNSQFNNLPDQLSHSITPNLNRPQNLDLSQNPNFDFKFAAPNQKFLFSSNQPQNKQFRALDQVQCFKCGEMGHYANNCAKPATNFSNHQNKP